MTIHESQLEWRERLLSAGLDITPVMDRIYFKSIYTRDPDGHIVELATLGPGFLKDEDQGELGANLKLPPWLEPQRTQIESGLNPVKAKLDENREGMEQFKNIKNGPHQGQPVYITGERLENAQAAMVLLHGRGASAADILTLAGEINLPGFAYLAPEAARGTWYPYSFIEPRVSNEPWLSSALTFVQRIMENIEKAGFPLEKTFLLGFSQGACLALDYAARHPNRYGGIAGLSGGLIGSDQDLGPYSGSLEDTPVFLGCSDVDPHIPKERVDHTAEVFQGLGAEVTKRIYPNMGHTVNLDELEFVRKMMSALL
jgi:glyoxalase family protein